MRLTKYHLIEKMNKTEKYFFSKNRHGSQVPRVMAALTFSMLRVRGTPQMLSRKAPFFISKCLRCLLLPDPSPRDGAVAWPGGPGDLHIGAITF
jgi:hypothetical protein